MATPEEIAAAKEGLTTAQLEKLGGADPTDPFIRARLNFPPLPTQVTVPSKSVVDTINKYERSDQVAASVSQQVESGIRSSTNSVNLASNDRGRPVPVSKGAMPAVPPPASVSFRSITGDKVESDMRVKIRVPETYFTELTAGPNGELRTLKGIIFPYTPSISYEHKADYSSQNPMHSNFSIYFYQRSSVSPISITGKFTVANETEAEIYLATVHLLRALTKMRSGGPTGDADSGSPPPVCRLDAYGTFMLQNVPVAISSYAVDLPDNVDYFTVGKQSGTNGHKNYEKTAVPVVSTIKLTCIPMYSRDEMMKFNVTQWLGEKYVRKAGYL